MGGTAHDAIVVGGGLVGSAIALGLADAGLSVTLLDEGDVALRASRGNFGLVWVQGKGLPLDGYAPWTRRSSDLWPDFADRLTGETGREIDYQRQGGFHLCLNEEELQARALLIKRLHNQAGPDGYDCRVLDRDDLRQSLPGIGDAVVGGTFCPYDGCVNPLALLQALHAAGQKCGVTYLPGRRVDRIEGSGTCFAVRSGAEIHRADRLVLAAGLANRPLGAWIGLDVPVSPERGQVLVTERAQPWLDLPTTYVRQMKEGSVLLGDSHEDVGFDTGTTVAVTGDIATRALRTFPALAHLRVVRTWGALRVMTPDGCPVYDESDAHPGAYAVSCHSGVTLAAAHANVLAPAIADGSFRNIFAGFTGRRFDVSAH